MLKAELFGSESKVIVPAGVHHISEPIVVKGKNIQIIGEDGAVIRGTIPLSKEDFVEVGPGVWCAKVLHKADAFYIGDRKYKMSRYPKADQPNEVFEGYAADCIYPTKTKEWADPSGGYIHAMHAHLWGGYSYRIEGKNEDGTLILSGGWQNNRQMGMHGEYRYAENIREEMTDEGEWYFDEQGMRIYVRVCKGDDLDKAEYAVSKGFFVLEDCDNVSIESIIFERSNRTFMETKEPLLRSDWTIYRGGAVLVQNSSNCAIDRCVFRDIGSNGVFVDGKNENIQITRSHFSEIGASGLCFVGNPESVRSPLFEYNERQSADDIDTEKGPKTCNYPKKCVVEDCLIEKVGITEKQATGVQISMSYGITVKNCTICHTSRSGINISEGTFGGHKIEGCDVFNTVRETGDHGSFNSWGRDRYWQLEDLDEKKTPEYALLDMIEPNTITRSRFRCDKGWDIDLDDGSSNYLITENLCLNGGIKLREGFFRTVRNNIMVNNTVHFHVWYPNSGDIVENNIVFKKYAPIGMPQQWGTRIDQNILYSQGRITPISAKELADLSKQDDCSILLDPEFADPLNSNFIPTNSFIRGFESFPTEFGVRYKPLREKADVPVVTVGKELLDSLAYNTHSFCAMTVKNIEDDSEMSVYGTAGHSGVLILKVEKDSEAQSRGLLCDDVIVGWGSTAISSVDDLEGCVLSDDVKITVIRKQNRIII